MSDKTQAFDAESFDKAVSGEAPVVVDFWAEWCGPCKALGPTIDGLADAFGDRVVVGKVNIDDQQELAVKFGIQSIPTVLVFHGGEVIDKLVGIQPAEKYKSVLDRALGVDAS